MIRIAFLGDIALFEDETLSGVWQNKFQAVANELKHFDLVVANLETPITEVNFTAECKGIHLKTSKKIIGVLKMLNVSIVSLANNHVCDFGIRGLSDTIDALNSAGIKYYGVNGISETLLIKGESLTFHGYCCYSANGSHYSNSKKKRGTNALTRERVMNAFREDKQKKSFSIISLHWGDEYSNLPNERQVHFMHDLADDYSFVLHGHHTHAMQGVKQYKGAVIAYRQGNFCFDEVHSTVDKRQQIKQSDVTAESFILSVDIEKGDICNWTTIGIFNNGEVIQIVDNSDQCHIYSEMISHCEETEYKKISLEMIRKQKNTNLGKHDAKWLLSKLNYCSISAKILWYYHDKMYRDAF